jgi:two-component system, chemotaxis family, CheB/CheR fusion protein
MNLELAESIDTLRRANAQMRILLENMPGAALWLDRTLSIRYFTASLAPILNLDAADRGRPIAEISHNFENIDLAGEVRRALEAHAPFERAIRQRAIESSFLMKIQPYAAPDDGLDGVLVTFVDVTAVVVAEEQQRLLVAELNHRVRNMLQVVMGLANQSIRKSENLEQFGDAFFGRMQALARAYELLSREGWHKAPVTELLHSQLSAFATEDGRYSVSGENLVLKPNAALSLGLVLYELCANATKYGALSTPSGHIQVSWGIEIAAPGRRNFVLRWKETGGPAVRALTPQGFGSQLVERQLRYELGGTADMDFIEDGWTVTLTIPASEVVEMVSSGGSVGE